MKAKTFFTCQNCGYQSAKWLGRCPDCNKWNTLVEEDFEAPAVRTKEIFATAAQPPVLLKDVFQQETARLNTGIGELDRVLGGGVVPGSVVLVGGDPGVGKSTLALQLSNQLAGQGKIVLYVSGEESVAQTKLRAERLRMTQGNASDTLYLVSETDLTAISAHCRQLKPAVVIIDSIQVIFSPEISSSPGSVSQVRECAGLLTQFAKATGTAVFIIGHVTKEGAIAGPRVLEHMVDTVLYFEGERMSVYRILRAVKNRFGSTNEIGVFEMAQEGLRQVSNPSHLFLSERPKDAAGSVVVPVIEGTRPLLVEIQALVSRATFGYPSRRSQGFDDNRMALLVAVLEKRIGLHLETEDIFVNVVGGIKLEDPAADLAVALAIASAFRDKTLASGMVVVGEVGLAGEIRSITHAGSRINEAAKLGFSHCVLPRNTYTNLENKAPKGMTLLPVASLKEAFDLGLRG